MPPTDKPSSKRRVKYAKFLPKIVAAASYPTIGATTEEESAEDLKKSKSVPSGRLIK